LGTETAVKRILIIMSLMVVGRRKKTEGMTIATKKNYIKRKESEGKKNPKF